MNDLIFSDNCGHEVIISMNDLIFSDNYSHKIIISTVRKVKLWSCDVVSIQKSYLCAAKFILYSSSHVSYVCIGVRVLQRCWCTPVPWLQCWHLPSLTDTQLIITDVAQDKAIFNINESTVKGRGPIVVSDTSLGPVHHFGSITELQGRRDAHITEVNSLQLCLPGVSRKLCKSAYGICSWSLREVFLVIL